MLSRRGSRATLAIQAYPGLRRRALQAKAAFSAMIAVALATAIIAVGLSGEVAFAKSLLDRYVVLDNERTTLIATISQVENASSTIQASSQHTTLKAADAPIAGIPPCSLKAGNSKATRNNISARRVRICNATSKKVQTIFAHQRGIRHFVPSFLQADWIFDSAAQAAQPAGRRSAAGGQHQQTIRTKHTASPILDIVGADGHQHISSAPMLYGVRRDRRHRSSEIFPAKCATAPSRPRP